LQAITEDKYEIIQSVGDAAIVIKNTKEPPLALTIHLTSPVVREELEKQLAGGTGGGGRAPAGGAPARRRCCLADRACSSVSPGAATGCFCANWKFPETPPSWRSPFVRAELPKLSSTFPVGSCAFFL